MKQSKALKIFLIIAGLLLTFIGGSSLLMPVEMKATGGIDLTTVSAINDARAAAALLFGAAILILSGAFSSKLTFTSTLVAVLVFLSLGVGRALSIALDGMPADGLFKATILEFVLGSIGLFLLVKNKPSNA